MYGSRAADYRRAARRECHIGRAPLSKTRLLQMTQRTTTRMQMPPLLVSKKAVRTTRPKRDRAVTAHERRLGTTSKWLTTLFARPYSGLARVQGAFRRSAFAARVRSRRSQWIEQHAQVPAGERRL